MVNHGLTQSTKGKFVLYLEYTNKRGKKKVYYGKHAIDTAIRMNYVEINRMRELQKFISKK